MEQKNLFDVIAKHIDGKLLKIYANTCSM